MPEDKELSKKLKWCLKASNGIELIEPSENLAKAYMEKSETALRSMEANAKADIKDWFVSASYYAKYFAVYALLSKFGFRCENHDCTIALFEYLLKDNVPKDLVDELKASKSGRIEAQYYTTKITVNVEGIDLQTKNFVLEMGKLVDSTTRTKIEGARATIKDLVGK